MPKLTAAGIKKVTQVGLHGDGNGLYLNVAKSGSTSWIQRITIDGKRRDMGLGGYPTITLAKAREIAGENRRAIAEGRNPLAEKKAEAKRIPTFKEAAKEVHKLNLARHGKKYCSNWIQRAEKYAFGPLGDMPIDTIGRQNVLGILNPIWTTKQETARRVREIIKSTLAWGQSWGYVDLNPAGEIVSAALPAMPKFRQHFRALPYQELAGALALIRNEGCGIAAKLAVEFLALTASRSGEVRGATWAEIDLEKAMWVIPASRMKGGLEHRIPLSRPAMAILEQAKEIREGDMIFPSPAKEGQGLSDMTLTKILRTSGLADRMTIHGIRSSFRDWVAEETATPWAVAELALAHRVGTSVEQAYHRTDLLEKRRALMDDWGEFLNP